MRVGGDFFYSPNEGHQDNLLLIAGGVGINPLYSIMQYASELMLTSSKQTKNSGPQRVKLLYSASSVKEMLFKVCWLYWVLFVFYQDEKIFKICLQN